MTTSEDKRRAQIRESIHTLNNALNAMVIQAELVRVLASDSKSHDRISACIDTVLHECQRSGQIARDIRDLVLKHA